MDARIKKSIKVLETVIKDLDFENPKQFSDSLGFERPERIYKIFRGKSAISKNLAEIINKKYPQFGIDWLLTGEGSMKKNGKTEITEEPGVTYEDDVTLTSLKKDLNQLSVGMTKNFEVLSEGIFQTLQRQEKIIDFIENINAEEISKATKALSKYLQEHK